MLPCSAADNDLDHQQSLKFMCLRFSWRLQARKAAQRGQNQADFRPAEQSRIRFAAQQGQDFRSQWRQDGCDGGKGGDLQSDECEGVRVAQPSRRSNGFREVGVRQGFLGAQVRDGAD